MSWIFENYEKITPILMIILSVISFIVYIIKGNSAADVLYWIAAALITTSVAFRGEINNFFRN